MAERMTKVQPPFLWKFGYYILWEEYQVTTLTTNALDLLKINLMRHISLIFPFLALETNGFIIPEDCVFF